MALEVSENAEVAYSQCPVTTNGICSSRLRWINIVGAKKYMKAKAAAEVIREEGDCHQFLFVTTLMTLILGSIQEW